MDRKECRKTGIWPHGRQPDVREIRCAHLHVDTGPAGLSPNEAKIYQSYCHDCHTQLFRTPEEERKLAERLARLPARGRTKPRTVDLKNWLLVCEREDELAAQQVADALRSRRTRIRPQSKYRQGHPAICVSTQGADSRVPFGADPALAHELATLGFDPHLVRFIPGGLPGGYDALVVTGGNRRATLYACLGLAKAIRQGRVTDQIEIRQGGAFDIRGGFFSGEEGMLFRETSCGYFSPREEDLLEFVRRKGNMLQIGWHYGELTPVTFRSLLGEDAAPSQVRRRMARLRRDLALCRKYHVMGITMLGLLHPTWAFEELTRRFPDMRSRGDELHAGSIYGAYCPSHPMTRKFWAAQVGELFETFEDLSGLCIWPCDVGTALCFCPRCMKYPQVQRVIDYIRIAYDAMRAVRPDGLLIIAFDKLEWALPEIARRVPRDIYFATMVGKPPGRSAAFFRMEDPDERSLAIANRISWFSRHSESIIPSSLPVAPFGDMQADVQRQHRQGQRNMLEQSPLALASLARPQEYLDMSEPADALLLALAWNPHVAIDQVLGDWADMRFAEARDEVVEILRKVEAIGAKPQVNKLANFYGMPFRWDLLDPRASVQVYSSMKAGPRLYAAPGVESPCEPKAWYVYPKELRNRKLTRKTLSLFADEFNIVPEMQAIVKCAARAARKVGNKRLFCEFQRALEGGLALAHVMNEFTRAGLYYVLGRDAKGSAARRAYEDARRCLMRCARRFEKAVRRPKSYAVSWTRWAQFSDDARWFHCINERLAFLDANLGRPHKPIQLNYLLPGSPRARRGFETLRLDDQNNADMTKGWQLQPLPGERRFPSKSLMPGDVPCGPHRLWKIPFRISEPSRCLLVKRSHSLAISGPADSIHFLLTARGSEKHCTEIAKLVVNYKDGSREVRPFIYGVSINASHATEDLPEAKVAWINNRLLRPAALGGVGSLLHYEWQNPRPAQPICSVRVIGAGARAQLCIAAITVRRSSAETGAAQDCASSDSESKSALSER